MPSADLRGKLARATSLHARGVEQFNHHRPSEARKLHMRALKILTLLSSMDPGEHSTELAVRTARVWLSLTETEADLYGADRGELSLNEARLIAEQTGHEELGALVHGIRGWLHLRAGKFVDALDDLDVAVARAQAVTPFDRCAFLINRGFIHLSMGNLANSRSDLRRADELAAEGGFSAFRAAALHNLGYLSFLQGDLPRALSEMQSANDVDEQGSLGGIALLDHARVLMEAGLLREATESLAHANEVFRRDRLSQDLAETELAQAECALLTGDIAMARSLASRARTRFRRRGSHRWRRSAELVLLQGDLAAGRPGSRLAPPALLLAKELGAAGLKTEARMAMLLAAEAYINTGDLERASRAAADAGAVRRNDPISTRLHTRFVRAQLSVASGAVAHGQQEIRTGLDDLANHQAKFGSIDMQTSSAVHGRRLAQFGVSVALRSGKPADVVSAAERSRATSRRLRSVRPPSDEVTAELLTELRKTVERIRGIESDPAAVQQVTSGRRRVVELERQIRERSWTSDGLGESERPVSVPQIRGALEQEASTMLMFVASGESLHGVTVRAGGAAVRVVDRPLREVTERINRVRADLDVLANDMLPAQLRSVVLASLQSSLRWLDNELLRPFHRDGDGELVIVPTGVLTAIPWGSLESLRSTPIVVTPSASAWLSAEDVVSGTGRVTAVAGPELQLAEDEAASIANIWGARGRAVVGAEANQDAFASGMVESSVLHVAAHGRHQMDSPLFSSIRLADGPLFAYELDQISRVPEHVILAACELGLATVGPGDEALGLTSVLLHWGSRCVVSGVARVADDAAASVMVDYHRRLAKGIRSSAALADAIAGFDGEAPIPFVCFGAAYSSPLASA
ncbi:CHAT domain-containing protein [Frankineae bacterium MT45]|nr:CHAT domain-containing protein [Frankineae bacterium MT45]